MKQAFAAILFTLFVGSSYAPGTAAPLQARSGSARISGSVAPDCTLTTLPTFDFTIGVGAIHSPGSVILAQGALAVRCSKHASVMIGMNTGLNGNAAGSKFGSRSMKANDGSFLGYDLCHDSGCASVWQPSGFTFVSTSDAALSLPVWARILSGQPQVKQDTYSDAVVVTVSF